MHYYNVECTVDNKVYELMGEYYEDDGPIIFPCRNCVARNDMNFCIKLADTCTQEETYPNSFWVIKQVPE